MLMVEKHVFQGNYATRFEIFIIIHFFLRKFNGKAQIKHARTYEYPQTKDLWMGIKPSSSRFNDGQPPIILKLYSIKLSYNSPKNHRFKIKN